MPSRGMKSLIPATGFLIAVVGGCAAKPDRKRMAATRANRFHYDAPLSLLVSQT